MDNKRKGIILLAVVALMISACSRTDGTGTGTTSEQRERIRVYFYNSITDTEVTLREDYPDYFAGGYRNSDGDIVVYITNNSKIVQNEIKGILEGENLLFEKVEYSLKDLKNTGNYVWEKKEELYEQYVTNADDASSPEYELLVSINGGGISEESNRYIISVQNLTEEKKETFKRLFPDVKGIDLEEGGFATGV